MLVTERWLQVSPSSTVRVMYTPRAGSSSCSAARFNVGKVNLRPVPVPVTTSPVSAKGRPRRRPAWDTSPSATSRRMIVLETTSPWHSKGGIITTIRREVAEGDVYHAGRLQIGRAHV